MHEARDAIANVAFNAGNGQRGKPTGNAGGVSGGGKVGQGIAEGAVKIEGKGVDGHGVLRWVYGVVGASPPQAAGRSCLAIPLSS